MCQVKRMLTMLQPFFTPEFCMAGLHKLARVKQTTKRTVSQMVLFAVPLVKSINFVSLPSPIRKKKKIIHKLLNHVEKTPDS